MSAEIQVQQQGFVEDMDFDAYAKVPALNGSSIVHMRRSAMRYRYEKDNPQPATAAMILGTATHRLILEPNKVGEFAVWGELPTHKVRNGRVWDEFQMVNQDRMIVTKRERDEMVGMAVQVAKNPLVAPYIRAEGPTELSLFWEHPFTKRRMKARIDKLLTSSHTIVDLKTTRDCRPHKFGGQAYGLGYHIKLACYWQGYKILTGREPAVKLLAVESKPPHECAVFNVPRELLMLGLEELDRLIALLDECEEANAWPPAQQMEEDLQLPAWASIEDDTALELEMD